MTSTKERHYWNWCKRWILEDEEKLQLWENEEHNDAMMKVIMGTTTRWPKGTQGGNQRAKFVSIVKCFLEQLSNERIRLKIGDEGWYFENTGEQDQIRGALSAKIVLISEKEAERIYYYRGPYGPFVLLGPLELLAPPARCLQIQWKEKKAFARGIEIRDGKININTEGEVGDFMVHEEY